MATLYHVEGDFFTTHEEAEARQACFTAASIDAIDTEKTLSDFLDAYQAERAEGCSIADAIELAK